MLVPLRGTVPHPFDWLRVRMRFSTRIVGQPSNLFILSLSKDEEKGRACETL
jgi:hypothetical protein